MLVNTAGRKPTGLHIVSQILYGVFFEGFMYCCTSTEVEQYPGLQIVLDKNWDVDEFFILIRSGVSDVLCTKVLLPAPCSGPIRIAGGFEPEKGTRWIHIKSLTTCRDEFFFFSGVPWMCTRTPGYVGPRRLDLSLKNPSLISVVLSYARSTALLYEEGFRDSGGIPHTSTLY